MGAKNDGKLVAAYADLAYEAGAFPGSMVSAGAQCIFSPYDIENMKVDGYDVLVNKPKTAAYRAPAAPNAAFAGEAVVDEIAQKVGMDPIEFRLLNASKEGTRRIDGPLFPVSPVGPILRSCKRPGTRNNIRPSWKAHTGAGASLPVSGST